MYKENDNPNRKTIDQYKNMSPDELNRTLAEKEINEKLKQPKQ